jgi:hypothetical protein
MGLLGASDVTDKVAPTFSEALRFVEERVSSGSKEYISAGRFTKFAYTHS